MGSSSLCVVVDYSYSFTLTRRQQTGLFSAAVASLISVSVQDLQQNPQDTSNFYLANMYQATINPNTSSSLPTSPPQFTSPNHAVWVNALWFLSLVISITCALLATLLQQWARRYLKVTQPRYSPHRRARIRAFFAEGVDKFLLPWAVEALPTMLHLSLFLFFAGLSVFLWNVNLTIFKLVLSWIGLCTALYGCITFIPVFRHDSPYHTPLSLPVWQFIMGIPFLTFRALAKVTDAFHWRGFVDQTTYERFVHLAERYSKWLVQGMRKTAEEAAFGLPSEIDTRAFLWTFDSLDEDHELEHFFSGLPGFRSSKMVKDPLPDLTPDQQGKILNALVGLSDRTSSSNLLPEPVKIRRTVICGKAIGSVDISQAIPQVFGRIVSEEQYGQVQSAETARLVRGWDNGRNGKTTMIIRAIFSSVIARAQRRDDVWFAMAADEIGVPESVLRNHATHGSNLSLAILIHVVHQQISLYWKVYWPSPEFSKVLEAASKFDVLDTSPELQHEFCALWNQVIRGANPLVAWWTLRPICNIYLTLHRHTDSAPTAFDASTGDDDRILNKSSTYPLCNVPGHRSHSTPHTHEFAIPTAISHTVLPGDVALVPSSLAITPDAPSPSPPTAVNVDNNPMDVPLLDSISVPASLNRAHQTDTESVRDFATSLDPVAASAARNSPSTRTMPSTTRITSTSTSSVLPPAAGSLQIRVHSGAQEILSSASPEPVIENTLPTGTPSTLTLPCPNPTNHLYSEPRPSIMASTSPGTSPWPTPVPEAVVATGSEDNPEASFPEHKGDLDLLPVDREIQANVMAVDRPSQLPPLPSATDIAIAGPSRQEPDDGPTTEHPSHDRNNL
jgi:hypothetical protein